MMRTLSRKQKVKNFCRNVLSKAKIELEAIGETADREMNQMKNPRELKMGGFIGYKKK